MATVIRYPVGRAARNSSADVKVVQHLLANLSSSQAARLMNRTVDSMQTKIKKSPLAKFWRRFERCTTRGLLRDTWDNFLKKLTLFPLFLLALCGCEQIVAAAPSWDGAYVYEANLGETVGGVTAASNYRLTLSHEQCTLKIQGYQVDEAIRCETKEVGNSISVVFVSFSNGDVKNIYGVEAYPPGKPLFSLYRSGRLVETEWQELKPTDETPKMGNFFSRQK